MKVTFCGHGDIDSSHLEGLLYNTIEKLFLQGADEFYLGGYGKFDIMCATVLRKLKTKYPHIASVLVPPISINLSTIPYTIIQNIHLSKTLQNLLQF